MGKPVILIIHHPVLGPLDVVELPFPDRPEKDQPAAATEKER
jgi:hypothetical protein